jgi:hypothetical protein
MSFGIPVRNGLGLGLLASTSLATGNVGSAPFTPASLFASGAPGFLLDATLSNLSSLFQDSAGTIPVTAVEQSVGLVLDTSQGLALGPELVTNGTFDSGTTGWTSATGGPNVGGTLAASGGLLTLTVTGTVAGAVYQGVTTVVGKTYEIEVIITSTTGTASGSGNSVIVRKMDNTNILAASNDVVFYNAIATGSGVTVTGYFTATATTSNIFVQRNSQNNTVTIDNISVKSIAGNHFVQSTPTARPVLSARVNLLTKTEQFDDAAWAKFALNTTGTPAWVNAAVAPDGTTTADFLIPDTSIAAHVARQTVTVVNSTHKCTVYAKANGYNYLTIQFASTTSYTKYFEGVFNVSTGAVETTGRSGTYTGTRSIQSVGNGWYQCEITINNVDANSTSIVVALPQSTNDPTTTFAGDGTSGVLVWGADLRVANDTASPVYQRVNTATDYATTGFPIYLRFNETGTDDFLVSAATVNFSTTAQMSVFAGVRKLSDAAYGTIIEFSAVVDTNQGSFAIYNPNSAKYDMRVKGNSSGSAYGSYQPETYTSPITNVLTMQADLAGVDLAAKLTPRVNGVVERDNGTIVGSGIGTGNFGNYLNYIGMRAGATLPLNGRIYFPMVVLGRIATATEIANMESYLSASMGGGYVPTGYDFLVTGDGDQLTDASGNALYTIPLYS